VPSPSYTTMPCFTGPSPTYSTSETYPLYAGSTTCCGPNGSCRTVSSIGSTISRVARVQLHPYEQRETFASPSARTSNDDLLEDSDAPTDDASKQDFDFDDVFNHDHNGHSSATSYNDSRGSASESGPKGQMDFSFSHYTGHIKGAGSVKMTRTKSGHLRPRVAWVKSGCRRAGCRQCQQP
jgi:hypothetical protein